MMCAVVVRSISFPVSVVASAVAGGATGSSPTAALWRDGIHRFKDNANARAYGRGIPG